MQGFGDGNPHCRATRRGTRRAREESSPARRARGAIDTGRQSQPSLPKRSQGSDGGGPLTRTADIPADIRHDAHIDTHRQAQFPHGRIKCCSNALDVRDRHRKVTPRPQGQPFPRRQRHAYASHPPTLATASTPANRTTLRARQRPPLEANPERNPQTASASTVMTHTAPLTAEALDRLGGQ